MSDGQTYSYTFEIPADTGELLDRLCAAQPGSPPDNIASRAIRDGIEALIALYPEWGEKLNHEPHKNSVAMMLARKMPA